MYVNARIFKPWALLLILGAALGVGNAFANVLWDQTTGFNGNGLNIIDSRLADDFVLSASSNSYAIQGISFYYIPNSGSGADLGSVTYAIYQNNAGALGTLLQTETIAPANITETDQAANPCGLANTPDCFLASFAITQLTVSAGTYFLEIHSGTTLDDASGTNNPISWAAVDDQLGTFASLSGPDGSKPTTADNFSGFRDFAFEISGQSLPEPGTFGLLALGAGLLAFKASRRPAK
jgi:hypothetical protein